MRLPKSPPNANSDFLELLQTQPSLFINPSEALQSALDEADDRYWNWEDTNYRAERSGLNGRDFWALVKCYRRTNRIPSPTIDCTGRAFTFRQTNTIARILHAIDFHLGGTIGSTASVLAKVEDQQRYLVTSLREEAMASSMIEGAVVTREQAKEMVQNERQPRDKNELMVLNNFNTIRYLNQHKDADLTTELICDVQARITRETLEKSDASGRFRLSSENIVVADDETGEIVHQPPPADLLKERMNRLCEFANHRDPYTVKGGFIHPAVRAIILHFWLSYDHPFVDGNGRTARALFYWSMLRSGYWLAEYMTISSIILKQPVQYYRAFLNSEIDDNDLTYFIHYHLKVIKRSILELNTYIERKQTEQRELINVYGVQLNSRQRAILSRAIRDPLSVFTYRSHANSHGVSEPTAREDLLDLRKRGLLNLNRKGRQFEFTPVPDIRNKLGYGSR